MIKTLLPVICALALAACRLPLSAPTPAPLPTQTSVPPATATATLPPTASPTLTPGETETPPPPTIPPLLTSIPGIAASLTVVASTPGAEATLLAQQTMESATQSVQMNMLSDDLLQGCPDPSDPLRQDWLGIPVMPQATAGQVVETLIGSYYCFRAPVSVVDVETFYKQKLTTPPWVLQSDQNGSMTFIGLGPSGAQILFLLSGSSKKNDLIVAINVTNPVMLPTPKK